MTSAAAMEVDSANALGIGPDLPTPSVGLEDPTT
jgi:hypothetical protein